QRDSLFSKNLHKHHGTKQDSPRNTPNARKVVWRPLSDFSFCVFRVFRGFLMVYSFSHRSYRLPLRTPLRTAHGLWTEREGLIVRLEDESGRAGYGEIAPIPAFGTETLAEAREICGKFGDKVEGEVIDSVAERFGCVRFA